MDCIPEISEAEPLGSALEYDACEILAQMLFAALFERVLTRSDYVVL